MYPHDGMANTFASSTGTTILMGVEETRDTRRFNTLAEAEKFAETMRQVERFYRNPD
jgi:hypothetical protein